VKCLQVVGFGGVKARLAVGVSESDAGAGCYLLAGLVGKMGVLQTAAPHRAGFLERRELGVRVGYGPARSGWDGEWQGAPGSS
jgi:hypothetical protein